MQKSSLQYMAKSFFNQKLLHFFCQNVQSDAPLPPVPPYCFYGYIYGVLYTLYGIHRFYTLYGIHSRKTKVKMAKNTVEDFFATLQAE